MALLDRAPDQGDGFLHQGIGQFGQVVGEVLDGLQAGQVLRQQAEDLGMVHLAQDVHFAFGVAGMQCQVGTQVLAETGPVGGHFVQARIEQFVEEQWVVVEVIGRPVRGAHHVGHPAQGHRVLLEQGEVGAAAGDAFQEGQAAGQRGVGVAGGAGRLDQARSDGIEARAIGGRQLLVAAGGPEVGQAGNGFPGAAEAEVAEPFDGVVLIDLAEPQAGQRVLAGLRVGKYFLEMAADDVAMLVEHDQHGLPVGEAHAAPDLLLFGRVARQHVGLLVLDILQAMFQPAQEDVGLAQFLFGFGRDQLALGEQGENRQGGADLQGRIASAADELEDLGHEFDFADAAGAELDVIGHVLARHFATDLGMQVAHGVDGAEIEVLAEDEGPGAALQGVHPAGLCLALRIRAAVHDAGLDPGVALPFAALGDEVVFQRVERADQRPGITVRPQAHVDTEDLAVGGDVAERLDDALAEAVEEVEILDALLRPRRIAVLRVDENVIDIGRDVQLAPTELAHADHHQALRAALLIERFAVEIDQLAMVVIEREVGRHVGEQGHALDHLGQRRQAAQVAQFDVGHRPLAQAAQRAAYGLVIGEFLIQRRQQQLLAERLLPGGRQFGDQLRAGEEQVGQVAAMIESSLPAGIERGVHDGRSAV